MVITIFRSRLRAEHEEEYQRTAARMHDLAQNMAGFLNETIGERSPKNHQSP
jgi:hypothetical protein